MAASHLTYQGYKFSKASVTKVADALVVEQALQIDINGESFTVVMQTPGAENELVRGLLYGEDIFSKNTQANFEYFKSKQGYIERINVVCDKNELGKGYLNKRSLLSVSSCGICGKQELTDLLPHEKAVKFHDRISYHTLKNLQKIMFETQVIYHETGGTHGAAAFDMNGNCLSAFEDIGRHNALDKVVGRLLTDQTLDQAKILSFSGRVSYEIVSKCFRAKIPVIIAVSAPSSLAVDFAKEYGMTLIAFSRGENMTCYANPERLEQ